MLGLLVVVLLVELGHAAVSLPWSTTYNCPEQDTTTPLTCDGMGGWGNSLSSLSCVGQYAGTRRGQITSDANYPGGLGGRGLRIWDLDGSNLSSNYTNLFFTQNYPEVYVRFYLRYSLGYTWAGTGPVYDKLLYFHGGSSPVPEIDSAEAISIQQFGTPQGSRTWAQIMNGPTGDGLWHWYEFHLKAGITDGVAQAWVDGVLVYNYVNVNTGGGPGWNFLEIGENQATPANNNCAYMDMDDIVIRTTGPIGPVPVDRTSPSPPTGLQVN